MSKQFALVTGASSGIGAAYAARLAAKGFDLILVARRKDRLEALAARLRGEYGREVLVHAADLANHDDLVGVEQLLRDRKDIELLVNNAGLGAGGAVASTSPEKLENLILVNVVALTRLCRAVLPGFLERDRGTIVNIGSVIAIYPSAGAAAYSGSKAFVINFTRSLQAELAKTNVVAQVIMPGPVLSEFFGDRLPPFPEHLFMAPEILVDAALAALDERELIYFPTLYEPELWKTFDDARRTLMKAVSQSGKPAPRNERSG
jgi:uncharacterized protein